jgi:hypothetical protein
MEDQYETLTSDSEENCKTILCWFFQGPVEVRTIGGNWIKPQAVGVGFVYRRKKPAPKKIKKLVDRTREDFWPLIGRYWAMDPQVGKRFLIHYDGLVNDICLQKDWQIAPLGTEDWEPMQKEIEVEELPTTDLKG